MSNAGWRALLLIAAAHLAAHACRAQAEISQADLLRRLVDLDRLTLPPRAGERPRLFSSFDRRQLEVADGKCLHWDADDDFGQFAGRTDDDWDVLVDLPSPGALTRWWVDEPAGRVRVELDGRVVIEDEFSRLFSGAVAPFGPPLSGFVAAPRGATLYFPIGFARGARVLTQGFSGRYQIDALEFAAGTRVQTFSARLDEAGDAALEHVLALLAPDVRDELVLGRRRTATHAVQEDVAPGKSFVEELRGGGVIRALYVSLTDRVEPRMPYALQNCVIRLTWDGGTRPAVELPLAAFFGSGFDRNLYNSFVMGTNRWLELPGVFPSESWFMYSFWPMPFMNGARVEIENRNPRPIGLMLYMRVERATPTPESLRFRARFHVEDPCRSFDYPLLEAAGPGRVVGCVLNIDTPRADWWGRGDHKAWIDDDRGPSLLGTGTADFFGNLEPLALHAGPFSGVSLAAPHGKNSLYRWLLADALEFQRGCRLTIENWQPENQNDVYYNSVVYWYGPPSAETGAAGSGPAPKLPGLEPPKPLAADDLRVHGLRIPGAVEIEGRVAGEGWGSVVRQRDTSRVELSGRAAVQITATTPVAIALPAAKAGRYRLQLRTHPTRSFGTIAVALADGPPIGEVRYARDMRFYDLGVVALRAGENRLLVTCDRPATLDCWVLTPAGDSPAEAAPAERGPQRGP